MGRPSHPPTRRPTTRCARAPEAQIRTSDSRGAQKGDAPFDAHRRNSVFRRFEAKGGTELGFHGPLIQPRARDAMSKRGRPDCRALDSGRREKRMRSVKVETAR